MSGARTDKAWSEARLRGNIKSAIRQVWIRSPEHRAAYQRGRVELPKEEGGVCYLCEGCGLPGKISLSKTRKAEEKVLMADFRARLRKILESKTTDACGMEWLISQLPKITGMTPYHRVIQIDHIEPLADRKVSMGDWAKALVDSMFSPNLQRLCKECHEKKTAIEKARRRDRQGA